MIRFKVQRSVTVARAYFREHFKVGDYYTEEAHVRGEWIGEGARKLGLKAGVSERAFTRMCEGLHPFTGERLSARFNTTRMDEGRSCPNRRVFFDFTFSPTKSVSLMAYCGDPGIVAIHNEAVRVALAELETFSATRVRRNGSNETRTTGNLVGAIFRHDTSRELDPHLHTHCVVFNATHDAVEDRWKALDPTEILRAERFVDAIYQHELAKGLVKSGHAVTRESGHVEILAVLKQTRARFSKRHQQINAEESRLRNAGENFADRFAARERIARDTRREKVRGTSLERLRDAWLNEMSEVERKVMEKRLTGVVSEQAKPVSAETLLAGAEMQVFERNAVVRKRDVLTVALTQRLGNDVSLEQLRAAMEKRTYVQDRVDAEVISLPDQSSIEDELVDVVKRSVGTCRELVKAHRFSTRPLSVEQRDAVTKILGSKDGVIVFRGGAGTGKSHTLSEVVNGLKAAGHPVVVVAPQNQQVRGLIEDGLAAQTLARLLAKRDLAWGSVVIVDEAGQVSARQMVKLTRLALLRGARLILSGDTRQHGAVEATDALRLLETHAGVTPIELSEIRRQDPGRGRDEAERDSISKYREAVQAAAENRHEDSFDFLCTAGRVHEAYGEDRMARVVEAFGAALERRERTLVVSQTWGEVNRLNGAMHQWLEKSGKVTDVRPVMACQDIGLTAGEKSDPSTYGEHRDIVFVRGYGRFARGDLAEVLGCDEAGLRVRKDGKVTTIGFSKVDRFVVVKERALEIGKGDRLQLKMNGTSREGHGFANGELVTVHRHGQHGALVVRDDRGKIKTLGADQRMFNLGYAVTSYGSQGKTVDTVLFSDSGRMGATNRKQWYVTISRGRKNVQVFTEDREELRAAIMRKGDRGFAVQPVAMKSEPSGNGAGAKPKAYQPSEVDQDAARRVAWEAAKGRRAAQRQHARPGQRIRR